VAAQVNIRPFVMDDMLRINLREIDARIGTDFDAGIKSAVAASERGEAFTVLVDDEILAIGGMMPIFTGVAELWSLTGEAVTIYPLTFHKSILKILDYWQNLYNLHRIQCKVVAGHDTSRKWVTRMGFEEEGLMRKYDAHGRDFYLYARVKWAAR
jgi:hypothetical protein